MVGLTQLWLPIVLSAVVVFVVSSLIHMLTPWHAHDFAPLPDEDKVSDALRAFALPPGDYLVPRPGGREAMRSAAFRERLAKGPDFVATVFPSGGIAVGRGMLLWFVYSAVIGLFAAYVAGRALPAGAPYLAVFRFAGVTAFLGYAGALAQQSIWWHRSWGTTLRGSLDGLLYGLLTAGVFGWLWPR